MSTNLTRRSDPFDDLFRGFFIRPVDFGGLSTAEADPKGEMLAWRKAIVASLEREGRLGIVKIEPLSVTQRGRHR